MRPCDWKCNVKKWVMDNHLGSVELAEKSVAIFNEAFQNTFCKDRAWFGVHKVGITLVLGGIILAGYNKSGKEKGLWFLVDHDTLKIDGFEYSPVKSTLHSNSPLLWARSISLDTVSNIINNDCFWESYRSATQKVLECSRSAGDRDTVQLSRKKCRIIDILSAEDSFNHRLFPEEVS